MNEFQISKRIFFWTLFVLFWLISAIVIGYTFGYRFSFQKGIFIYGGSLTLKTIPKTVDVYLDGKLMPPNMLSIINKSYHINGITPGEHFLELRASGYQSWSKKISVHSGISTEFWNIILAQDSYVRENYKNEKAEKLFISPYKNIAAFTQQTENDFFVKVLDTETKEILEVFHSNDCIFTQDDKENIEWSPQAHKIIIPVIKNGEKNYFIVTIDTKESLNLKDISGINNLSSVRWDSRNKDVLFFMSEDKLYNLDTNNTQGKKIISEHIASYDMNSDYLFYFQLPEGIVYKKSLDNTDNPKQITTSSPENMSDNSYQIIIYDDYRIVFLNKSRNLYIYNKGETATYFKKLSDNVYGSQFSDDGKKLLFWTDKEISVYFMRKWEEQPTRNEDELTSLTYSSDHIQKAQWTADYEHVLFTNNNRIKLIEIDNRDNRNIMDVLNLDGNSSVMVNDFTDEKLYFTEKNDQGHNILYSIYFPELQAILQKMLPDNSQESIKNE